MDGQKTLLLVDDEPNILAALRRTLRREGYRILTAPGGEAALELLAQQAVDVIVSDQRMPGMSGVEFLSRVRSLFPDTVRIVLSGYTDLDAVTDAINRGAVYKFLTKPWEDELLKENIAEAFRYAGLRRENEHLREHLLKANEALQQLNARLEAEVARRGREAELQAQGRRLAQEIVEGLPLAVLGVDCGGTVVLANARAREALLGRHGGGLGLDLAAESQALRSVLEAGVFTGGRSLELPLGSGTVHGFWVRKAGVGLVLAWGAP